MLTVPLKLCVALMLVVLSSVSELQAQTAPDTARTGLLQMYWTKQRFVPKIGGSIQERALFELGVQWHNIYRHPLSLASKGPYAMIDVMINDDNLLLGPKLGYEFTAGLFGLAFDVTYYIDRDFDREGNDRRSFQLRSCNVWADGDTSCGPSNVSAGIRRSRP